MYKSVHQLSIYKAEAQDPCVVDVLNGNDPEVSGDDADTGAIEASSSVLWIGSNTRL